MVSFIAFEAEATPKIFLMASVAPPKAFNAAVAI